tara:strand:- start:9686 stop:10483 length:798 start_codon:yes stop_codon:yes gene_type:complete
MRFFLLILIITLSACSTDNIKMPVIYKVNIQQGNEIDSSMLLKLKPEMTKSQVKFILGTPLIEDSFHKDRWDYLYSNKTHGVVNKDNFSAVERRHVIVHFENELLKSISGEVIPGSVDQEGNSAIALKEHEVASKADQLEAGKSSESWLETLKFWKNDDKKVVPKVEIISPKAERSVTENDALSIKKSSEAEKTKRLNSVETIDIKGSASDTIQKDIVKSETNIKDDLTSVSDSVGEPIQTKQDIIESEPKAKDYFDLMLEKIGF